MFSIGADYAFGANVSIPQGTSVPACEETNECYIPYEVSIPVGGEVVWSNDDSAVHTVTGGSEVDGLSGIFDSSLFMAGTTFFHQFNESGIYPYFCMIHPWMEGIVKVGNYPYSSTESTETVITVKMNGPSTFYLDSPNKIIRAAVEIQNYTPSDGYYFMRVTHLPTQIVLKDFEIYPKDFGNDLWAVQIAYPILESDIKVGDQTLFGEYEIHITTENGSQTASTKFSIFELDSENEPEIPTIREEEPIPEPVDDVVDSTEPKMIELSQEDKKKIDSLLEKAQESFDNYDDKTAENYYDQVLRIDSNNLLALNGKAKSLAALGNAKEAMNVIDKAILLDPTFPNSYYSKGAIHLSLEQDKDALFYFEKAHELDPYGISPIIGKGSALYYLGRYSESISTMDGALGISSDNTDALSIQALSFTSRDNTGDQFSALMKFNRVLEIDPSYPDVIHNKKIVLNQIAQNYDSDNDFEKAISYYDQILEIDPKYIDALNNKAYTLYNMGKSKEALSYFDNALDVNPNFVQSLTGKGTILNDLGRYDEAIVLFDKTLRIDPSYSLAQQNKQFSLQEKSKIQQEITKKEQQNQEYMIIILGIIGGGSIIGGLIWFSKFKVKSNTVIVESGKKTELIPKSENMSNIPKEWEGI